ncbi:MAG: hypothetical protein D9V45_08145 [Chloroflexi bacterium]|nr:MAG: hypothetical protein D9V45_08145 [Chloroflexota bacterium]
MYQTSYPRSNNRQQEVTREYSRILSAAVVSAQFRQMLLSNPGMALTAGFAGEKFQLNNEDRNRLTEIRATTLADFASQLNVAMKAPVMGCSAVAAD